MKDENIVVFRPEYVDLTGDINAALLMSQIHYWYMPSETTGHSKLRVYKYGCYWLAKNHEEWWEETRLSRRQLDRAISILVEKKLIQVAVFRFNGLTTRHIICPALDAIPVFNRKKLRGASLIGAFASTSGVNCLPLDVQALTESTPENTKETDKSKLSLAGHTSVGSFEKTPEGEEEEMKGKGVKKKEQFAGKDLKTILSEVSKKVEPAHPLQLTATAMAKFWRDLCRFHGRGVEFHPPTQMEAGLWAQMIKLEKGRLPEVIRAVVAHWDEVSLDIMHSVGDKTRPLEPMIPYLRKHLTIAVNWYLLRQEAKQPAKASQTHTYNPTFAKKKEQVVTSEGPVDWSKIEAEIQGEGKPNEPSTS